ncbi:MAG TPA: hypothetical protein VFS20_14375 [Longimicrobium sp.]|nr:hypothetical protein [Longimicrobium sp.]
MKNPMDAITEWARILAEEVTPDETATASLVAEAYARGGPHRRQLLEDSGALTGGFGTGDLLVMFPAVLSAVHQAAPYLLALLASRHIGDLLGAVRSAVAQPSAVHGSPMGGTAVNAVDVPGLNRATDTIEKSLRQAGISTAEAELMALHVVHALLRDADNGRRFIQFIAEKA